MNEKVKIEVKTPVRTSESKEVKEIVSSKEITILPSFGQPPSGILGW